MEYWLPLVFLGLMGLAMLIYVVLDGYDLGVGVLMRGASDAERDLMIASIGPFWDANETWLVLGVGLLLIAFPQAHGVILSSLYLPVAAMLAGLILRGVAFDFRVKAREPHRPLWNTVFFAGSSIAAFAQGFMLGHYITGFDPRPVALGFAALIGACLVAGYALLGAGWLILKTEDALQRKAIAWARRALWLTGLGIAAVSVATPLVSPRVFAKWFTWPEVAWLAPIPVASAALFVVAWRSLARLDADGEDRAWLPLGASVGLFVLAFAGLAYSLFPYLVVDRITIWDAASAPESLLVILWGLAVTLPAILFYTVFSYRVFWGKVVELSYD